MERGEEGESETLKKLENTREEKANRRHKTQQMRGTKLWDASLPASFFSQDVSAGSSVFYLSSARVIKLLHRPPPPQHGSHSIQNTPYSHQV